MQKNKIKKQPTLVQTSLFIYLIKNKIRSNFLGISLNKVPKKKKELPISVHGPSKKAKIIK
jgi:hypothetical protein